MACAPLFFRGDSTFRSWLPQDSASEMVMRRQEVDGNSQTFVGGWQEAQRGSDEGSIGFELCLRSDVSFVSVQRGAAR